MQLSTKKRCTAIVLAAGQGTRMGTEIQKQYLELDGRPVLYYSLRTFQDSPLIDEIVLVVGEGQESYCRKEIVERFGIHKVSRITCGGTERYHSVWNGLQELSDDGYVFIHDGARPFVDEEIIERVYEHVVEYDACVVGMPVKDTIKTVDEQDFVTATPNRNLVWMIQTPQVFRTDIVKKAYGLLMECGAENITDDAMVVEQMLSLPIRLVRGSYENIKITTPEDLEIAGVFVRRKK
ncbi:2-C-methyl-D-erythritol 4-phosphate cytidylyltransferase [Hespellia stercorisuis]|uniref:2-C-methyl-D-erythritol 4-phosphate cytidylyltransferase n=1 Tax=Hespellia stercorisuis DSM 15480 TaxID=1121950 RepID=A0A1M6UL52_9FIRM|nr:2-C-methyl-D-erythritol 4-phosphate cytidylyltransferase [Hespellia stercorisuis]SHK69921.1 2-C-methyl-D-erythritol 4-phosphate cytidylyltransferase [Hespellia stercorisuis DSM 15480]